MISLVKVKPSFYNLCKQHSVHKELLFNENGRPCVLLVKLRYKNNLQDFVVPLRSNISPTTPAHQYFSLPPNASTKPKHKHGVHYIKLFPVHKQFIDAYNISGDNYYFTMLTILNNHEKIIVDACQQYLKSC